MNELENLNLILDKEVELTITPEKLGRPKSNEYKDPTKISSMLRERKKNLRMDNKKELKIKIDRIPEGGFPALNTHLHNILNCKSCHMAGTLACPNGIAKGEMHANGTCSLRTELFRACFDMADTRPRYFHLEEVVILKVLKDKMLVDWQESGKLDENFHRLSRNMIAVIEKMRRQDEGLKVQNDVNITHDEFRDLCRKEAEIIDAEYVDKNEKSNN